MAAATASTTTATTTTITTTITSATTSSSISNPGVRTGSGASTGVVKRKTYGRRIPELLAQDASPGVFLSDDGPAPVSPSQCLQLPAPANEPLRALAAGGGGAAAAAGLAGGGGAAGGGLGGLGAAAGAGGAFGHVGSNGAAPRSYGYGDEPLRARWECIHPAEDCTALAFDFRGELLALGTKDGCVSGLLANGGAGGLLVALDSASPCRLLTSRNCEPGARLTCDDGRAG